ncbi:hypothetical protein TRIATDRAFT_85065 [Trichoderma atroviride IMI 206040]|uniref:mRNA splicing factor RNA helicase n=1 Tax=Hypocrea atroviridis (strain ATCC 20476 / IMI 206040) TaxID=452589 RepID=G9P446_HYPAI|nr:uncharacterized protein TRIATDRAFT_85065 [Trichoderma atroviride IMI 206040]EHK41102.1 hypothetical protein TRIATDRAFT_85065 [Trichoderma atroviride IMI 206040]
MDDIQPEQAQPSPTIEPIRFRAGKKRKAYRQRGPAAEEQEDANDGVATAISPAPVMPGVSSKSKDVDAGRDADDTGAEAQNPTQGHSEREDNGDDGDDDNHTAEESAVAAALRLRNARRAASRRGGVGFRSEGRSAPGEEDDAEHALVLRDQDKEGTVAHDRIVGGITNRFMHQTGLLTILDDSHIRNASHAPQGGASSSSSSSQLPPHSSSAHLQNDNGNPADKWRDQPTRHGKLVEVDTTNLGNHQMKSDNKRRRVDTDTAKPAPPRRGRNRRNSEDIARDAMVEQFLSENRLDVYQVPKTHAATATAAAASSSSFVPGADPSADDRLAEQFRQQYYDEMALRRKRKRPAPTQQQKQQQQSADVLKGPKLGGSRNQRAAVRNILLQQERDKKGK